MRANSPHFRTCTLCEAMCGIRIDLDGAGRIAGIRGDEDDPFSRGHVCPKATALAEVHEDPDRLRAPIRRTGDRWEEVSWDEALDEAARGLHRVQEAHGRHTVASYFGNPTVHNLGAMLFGPMLLRTLRTHSRYSATSVDQLPHMVAAYYMFGHQLLLPIPDIDRADHFLILGANPLASNGSLMTAPDIRNRLRAIRQRGGKVVVVDPRRTETARDADEHVFIRPGTDALLLAAMLQVVFEEGLDRRTHVRSFADGEDALREAVAPFTPERAADPTGVEAPTIRRLARELATAERGVAYGRIGLSTQAFGGLCQWLLNALNAVTGHLDREGGAMFPRPAIDALGGKGGFGIGRGSHGRWASRVRGLPEFGGELPVATLAEDILEPGDGRIRALVTMAGNPVLSTPNGAQLDRALASLEFMVSIDFYLNETTRHARLILPPTSPLEHGHYDLAFHLLAVRNTAKWSEPLFDPPAEAKHDWEILLELVHRLEGLRGRSLRQAPQTAALRAVGPEGIVDLGLRLGAYGKGFRPFGKGLSLRALRQDPHGIDLGPLEPCLPERLRSDGQRIDLAPAPFLRDMDRLKASLSTETATATGELLLIGRRQLRSNNSWMHNTPGLMKGRDRCTLLMHPDDAASLGLADGAPARVRSRVGEVEVPVEITRDLMPGVVSLPHGFGHGRPGVRLAVAAAHAGASLNDLTDDHRVDALTGNAALSGVPVQVAPA
ncbi:MAG: molybdopterin oxidoreductase family protein [Myxococcota bacterium]